MIKIIYLFLLIIICPFFLFPQDQVQSLNTYIVEYYKKPDFETLNKIMNLYDSDDELKNNENGQWPMRGFLSVAFSKLDSAALKILIDSLYAKNNIIVQSYEISRNINEIVNSNDHFPGMNDFFWGAFFASGERKYIERLASELYYLNEKDSLLLYMTGASAKWSLSANAIQHPLVKEYILQIKENVDEETKLQLIQVLEMSPSQIREEMVNGVKEYKKRQEKQTEQP